MKYNTYGFVIILGLLLTGCGGPVKYDSSYASTEVITKFHMGLKDVILFTEPNDDAQVINKPPSHLYLGGDQQVALGEIIKSISIDVYGKAHENRKISHAKSLDSLSSYKIHPRAINFSYGFREGSSALFAPSISMVIEINVLDEGNDLILTKSYSKSLSGRASLGGDHTAAIRKLTHDAVYQILTESISDINMAYQKIK